MYAYAVCNGDDYSCIKFGFTKQEPYRYMRSNYARTYPDLKALQLYETDNGRLFEANIKYALQAHLHHDNHELVSCHPEVLNKAFERVASFMNVISEQAVCTKVTINQHRLKAYYTDPDQQLAKLEAQCRTQLKRVMKDITGPVADAYSNRQKAADKSLKEEQAMAEEALQYDRIVTFLEMTVSIGEGYVQVKDLQRKFDQSYGVTRKYGEKDKRASEDLNTFVAALESKFPTAVFEKKHRHKKQDGKWTVANSVHVGIRIKDPVAQC